MIERSETMRLMDELETLVLKKGWPVPFTPYYLVHHERMLVLVDRLRASLRDEMDSRFIKAFTQPDEEAQKALEQKNRPEKKRPRKGGNEP